MRRDLELRAQFKPLPVNRSLRDRGPTKKSIFFWLQSLAQLRAKGGGGGGGGWLGLCPLASAAMALMQSVGLRLGLGCHSVARPSVLW